VLLNAVVLLALAADGGVAFFDQAPRDTGCAEYQVTYGGKCIAKKRFLVLLGTMAQWRESCESGDKRGCAPIGEAYRDGTLVPKSPEFAFQVFQRGCDAKEPMACRLLAEAYQKGSGVEASPEKALPLLVRSCELGEPPACTALGKALETGAGVKADPKKARAIYGKGCELGAQPACARAAELDGKAKL
jgi:TPR repeat protein